MSRQPGLSWQAPGVWSPAGWRHLRGGIGEPVWRWHSPNYWESYLCGLNCLGTLGSSKRNCSWIKVWHDDVIKWKHLPRHRPFLRGIHRSPVNSPHKGQWHGALMFSLICVWINAWVNNREAGDLRRYHAHDDVTVMTIDILKPRWNDGLIY